MEQVTLHVGDCIEVMRSMPDNSVDAIVTDPPYGLEFMGREWDAPWKGDVRQPGDADYTPSASRHKEFVRYGMSAGYGGDLGAKMRAFQQWCTAWAVEALRVLKPGGHLLAFGGSRTYHRLACAIEDAGFEVRDQIMWVYGSGFPKSKNLAGDWCGWGTALKPAHEPIVVARKPLVGTVAANVRQYGTGALNIDGCRVATEGAPRANGGKSGIHDESDVLGNGGLTKRVDRPDDALGRWPANLIHDGSEEVLALFPDSSGSGAARVLKRSAKSENNGWGMNTTGADEVALPDAGSGSAARFFYCAKASKADRGDGNTHPTVKPTALMRYLCRLVTPPGGVVLDPFMGSGSTGKAAMLEGVAFIGIERQPEYHAIAAARIQAAHQDRAPAHSLQE